MAADAAARVYRRDWFDLPEGVIYLDGNSLGPLPKSVPARVNDMIADEWGQQLIRGWNSAGWMAQPARIGNRVARLIGAPEGSVVIGDTLSIKVYQALAAALHMRPERRVILSDSGNFPTDLYMAQGLVTTLDDLSRGLRATDGECRKRRARGSRPFEECAATLSGHDVLLSGGKCRP